MCGCRQRGQDRKSYSDYREVLHYIQFFSRRMSNTSVNSSTDPDSDCHMHQRQMLRGMFSALDLANQRASSEH